MDLLEAGLQSLCLHSDEKCEKLRIFIAELERWNKIHNFVRAEGDDLIVRHVLDSLAPLQYLEQIETEDIADIGTGAGFPGIPLAVWMENRKIVLIEKLEKRCGFLRNVRAVCRLDNVDVMHTPVEQVSGTFGLCVFRALGGFGTYLEKIKPVLRPGTEIAAYKGKRSVIDGEIEALGREWEIVQVVPIDVPFLTEERHIVHLRYNT